MLRSIRKGQGMSRTALVTGGTRGIGRAISVGMKAAGYQVAANYAGNDAAAKAFEDETGVSSFKFDVSDFEATGEGLAKIDWPALIGEEITDPPSKANCLLAIATGTGDLNLSPAIGATEKKEEKSLAFIL